MGRLVLVGPLAHNTSMPTSSTYEVVAAIIVLLILKTVRGYSFFRIYSSILLHEDSKRTKQTFREIWISGAAGSLLSSGFLITAIWRGLESGWDHLALTLLGMGIAVSFAMLGWMGRLYWSQLKLLKETAARDYVILHFLSSLLLHGLGIAAIIYFVILR